MGKSALTAERLREVLRYEPETGLWLWVVSRGGTKIGAVAGTPHDGYVRIKIDGCLYLAHRLAWFWMTGEWPEFEVDHEDLDRANNRWKNLRHATDSQNRANTKAFSNNKSGFKGVSWHARIGKWMVSISVNRKKTHLGYFDCPAAGSFAYQIEADKAFGEFARSS